MDKLGPMLLLFLCLLAGTPCEAGECDKDIWHEHEGRFYLVRNDTLPVTYNEAIGKCQQEHATLATAKTAVKNDFLKSLLEERDVRIAWVGLSHTLDENLSEDKATRRQDWLWVDGTPLLAGDFHDWHKTEPNKRDQCLRIARFVKDGILHPYYWHAQRCDKPFHGYICERGPVRYKCEDGWRSFGEHCYLIDLSGIGYNWAEGKQFCEDNQAALLSIDSEEENAWIGSLFDEPSTNIFSILLSLVRGSPTDCGEDYNCFRRDWYWPEDKPGCEATFRGWDDINMLLANYVNNAEDLATHPKFCAFIYKMGKKPHYWFWHHDCAADVNMGFGVVCKRERSVELFPSVERAEEQSSSGSTLVPHPTTITFTLAALLGGAVVRVVYAW